MFGDECGRGDVVDAQGRDTGDRPADAHDGLGERSEQLHLVRRELDADRDDRVDALAHEEVLEDAAALCAHPRSVERYRVRS